MEQIYALIKNGLVVNTIVSNETFNIHIANQYDLIVRIDELEIKPGIGWTFVDNVFADPNPALPPEELLP